MKLYQVPRNTWVIPTEDTTAPPGAQKVSIGEPVLFKHIDGMYSYCNDSMGNIVHLPAWQQVKIVASI